MRLLLPIFLLLVLALPCPAYAEIKTITHTVQQPFGGSQSPDDARTAGIARAKREALERFGTYIESRTVVKNAQVDSDEILALTAGVTKAEVLKQKNYTDGDGFGLEITVQVELDTAVLDQSLKRLLQDRNHLKDLTAARAREKQLLARIAELEKQNNRHAKTAKQSEKLKKEFAKTRNGLTSVEWFDKASALWDGEKFSNSPKAAEYLTLAIHLDPTDAIAHNNRGIAYANQQLYQQAINDFSRAIYLDPIYTTSYLNRGIAYRSLKHFQQAVSDFSQMIRLNPTDARAFDNRGMAYAIQQRSELALADYDQAITLDPNYARAYIGRGIVYGYLKDYQRAINDFSQAIDISSPDDAKVYAIRGINYLSINNPELACKDLEQACRLGACENYRYAKEQRLCK